MSASPAPSAKPASLACTRIVSINLGLAGPAPVPPPPPPPVRRSWSLPIADPRKRFGPRRRYVPAHAAPRIIFFDGSVPHKPPPPPGPHDQIDATRLALRLAGIGRALADLPGQAQRYVRWKARNDVRRVGRVIVPRSPLRPGYAPGWRKRSKDEINEILADMQYFAREVLRAPDTS